MWFGSSVIWKYQRIISHIREGIAVLTDMNADYAVNYWSTQKYSAKPETRLFSMLCARHIKALEPHTASLIDIWQFIDLWGGVSTSRQPCHVAKMKMNMTAYLVSYFCCWTHSCARHLQLARNHSTREKDNILSESRLNYRGQRMLHRIGK